MIKNKTPYSYFELLDISTNASDDDVKAAYRKLAIKFHPDHNPGNKQISSDRFHLITEAYKALKTKEKRTYYKRWLQSQNKTTHPANNNTGINANKESWLQRLTRGLTSKSQSSS